MEQRVEPILQENPNRFVIFPLQHNDIWQFYKDSVATFWVAEEIDLAQDIITWQEGLTDDERHFIKHVLAFLLPVMASSMKTWQKICSAWCSIEAKFFYGYQIMIENIHSETYSLLIDTYIKDPQEKDYLFHAIDHMPCVKKKLIGRCVG